MYTTDLTSVIFDLLSSAAALSLVDLRSNGIGPRASSTLNVGPFLVVVDGACVVPIFTGSSFVYAFPFPDIILKVIGHRKVSISTSW